MMEKFHIYLLYRYYTVPNTLSEQISAQLHVIYIIEYYIVVQLKFLVQFLVFRIAMIFKSTNILLNVYKDEGCSVYIQSVCMYCVERFEIFSMRRCETKEWKKISFNTIFRVRNCDLCNAVRQDSFNIKHWHIPNVQHCLLKHLRALCNLLPAREFT